MNQFPSQGFPGQPGGFGMPPAPGPDANVGKKATKRSITSQKTGLLIFAIVVTLLVAAAQFGAKPKKIYVVQAAVAINALQPYSQGQLKAVALEKDAIEPGAFTDSSANAALKRADDALHNLTARQQVFVGEQLHPEFFTSPDAAGGLAPGDRLISVRAGIASSVAGTLRAGDHVDVIAIANSVANVIGTDETIVQATVGEEALQSTAAAQNQQKNKTAGSSSTATTGAAALPGDPIPGTYVFKVNAAQAQQFALADFTAKIYLVQRPAGQDSVLPLGPLSLKTLLCSPVSQGKLGVASTSEAFCKS